MEDNKIYFFNVSLKKEIKKMTTEKSLRYTSKELGIPQSTIRYFLKKRKARLKTIKSICKYFGYNFEDFVKNPFLQKKQKEETRKRRKVFSQKKRRNTKFNIKKQKTKTERLYIQEMKSMQIPLKDISKIANISVSGIYKICKDIKKIEITEEAKESRLIKIKRFFIGVKQTFKNQYIKEKAQKRNKNGKYIRENMKPKRNLVFLENISVFQKKIKENIEKENMNKVSKKIGIYNGSLSVFLNGDNKTFFRYENIKKYEKYTGIKAKTHGIYEFNINKQISFFKKRIKKVFKKN